MKRRIFLLLTASWVVCLLGMASPAKRIVSLSPSITKNLQYLNEENEIVGCTSYCKTSRPLQIVASAIKVNVEKVFSLKPDLVLATSMTPPETISSLRKLGLKVSVFPIPHSFDEICSQFLQLGEITGKIVEARKIVNVSRSKVDAIKNKPCSRRKVFIQLGANPLFAVIPHTFMHDYIVFSGALNITQGMTNGTITRETVLQRNPDVLFIVTMGMAGMEEKKQWENFKNLKAVKNKKIVILDSEKACMPTPITFVETLGIINQNIR